MAVGIARAEVHLRIHAGRVFAQHLLDARERFNEVAPVHRTQQAQAADAVADRHLCCRLALRFQLHQLVDRLVAFGQALLGPAQGQFQRGAAAVQAPRQFGDEGGGHRGVGTRHVRHHQDQALGVAVDHLEHAVPRGVRLLVGVVAAAHHRAHGGVREAHRRASRSNIARCRGARSGAPAGGGRWAPGTGRWSACRCRARACRASPAGSRRRSRPGRP
jgi:hypothetical protein